MGEHEWKMHREKKSAEAEEMDEIERRLSAIYSGMDKKKVGLLTSAKQFDAAPDKGLLLEYGERKLLTAGNASGAVTTASQEKSASEGTSEDTQHASVVDGAASLSSALDVVELSERQSRTSRTADLSSVD